MNLKGLPLSIKALLSALVLLVSSWGFAQPCLNGWQYSKAVTIINPTAQAQNDFQYAIEFDSQTLINQGKMKLDGSDIRVLNSAGAQLPIWIETNTFNSTQSKVWIKHSVNANSSDTVYLFYGASGATSASNGALVFDFFDGFSTALSPAVWDTCGAGNYAVSNGKLNLSITSTSDKAVLISKSKFANPNRMEMGVTQVGKGKAFIGNANVGGTSSGFVTTFEEIAPGINKIRALKLTTAGACFNLLALPTPDNVGHTLTTPEGAWGMHWYSSLKQGFSWNGGSDTAGSNAHTLPATSSLVLGVSDNANASLSVDWVRVRKHSSAEPSISLGNEVAAITTISASANASNLCQGSALQLNASSVTGATYAWTGPNGFLSSLQNPNIAGISVAASGWYKVTASLGSCSSASDSVQVQVSATTQAGTLTGADTLCSGTNSGVLKLSGQTGSVIRWESSLSGNAPWSSIQQNSDSLQYINLTASHYYRAVVKNGACNEVSSNAILIKIDQATQGGNVVGTGGVCSGNNQGSFQLLNANGSIQNWQSSTDKGTTWSTIVSSNPTNPKQQFSNLSDSTWYRAISQNGACAQANSDTLKVAAYPLPTVQFAPNNSCAGAAISLNNSSTIGSGNIQSYSWNFGNGSGSVLVNPTPKYSTSGKYSIQLTASSNKGCVASKTDTVIIHALPKAAFSAAAVCSGDSSSFNNSSSIATGSITNYNWSFGSTQVSPKYKFASAGSHQVQLTVTSDSGCVDSVRKNVMVNQNPTASFTADTVALGSATNFSNTSTIGVGALSASWLFGNGANSSVYSPSYTYNIRGKYQVELRVASQQGCKDTIRDSVWVLDKPVANFTIAAVCNKDTSRFINTSTYASGRLTYNWSFGDGSFSTDSLPKHVYAAAGVYSVKLKVTNAFGHTHEVTKSAVVHSVPQAKYIANSVCDTDTVRFTNQSTIASGSLNYVWRFGNGATSFQRNANYRYPVAGTYNTKLVVFSPQGCYDSTTTVVNVYNRPQVVFTADTVCLGDSMSFTNTSSIANGSITSYAWTFGNGLTSTANNPKMKYATAGQFSVKLVATSNQGCAAELKKDVLVNAQPIAGFSVNNVCHNDTALFVNTTSGLAGAQGVTYLWNFGDNTTSNSSANQLNHLYAQNGNYAVKLVVGAGSCTDSVQKNVSVYARPQVDFMADTVCLGTATKFTNNTQINSGKVARYLWNLGNGYNSIEVNPSITYSLPGIYQVSVKATSDTGCVASRTKPVVVYAVPVARFETQNVCDGDTVVFNNKSTLPVGNNTVTWQFGDGNSSTLSITTVKHLYANANAYSVKLKIATDNGCSDSMQTQVEVYANPQTAFNVDTVCFGLASEFKNSTQISKGSIASYLWDLGNGKTSIEHNPVIRYDHPATFNVKLKATSDKGCAIEIQKTARVNPQPVAKFEAESVCDGEPVSFNNKTEIQSGAINYLWNFGNEKTSTQTNEVVIYDKAGRYEVKLLAKTPQGCADSVSKALWSYALPQPFILAESDSLSKGFGTNLVGQGGKIYSWTPQESVSDPNARITVAKPQENTVYTLTVLDSNGCGASTSKSIRVYEDFILVASNVITPDNNGKNDTWFVKNTEAYDNVKVFIADRWGREVYTSDDYQNDWSGVNNAGEQLPDGNYYYIITHNSSDKVYKGTITLMRNN